MKEDEIIYTCIKKNWDMLRKLDTETCVEALKEYVEIEKRHWASTWNCTLVDKK